MVQVMANVTDSHLFISKEKVETKLICIFNIQKSCRISSKVGCDNMTFGGSHNIIPEKFQ
jgi:hypothetical protein